MPARCRLTTIPWQLVPCLQSIVSEHCRYNDEAPFDNLILEGFVDGPGKLLLRRAFTSRIDAKAGE